jgi:hypothetical protein
VISLAILRHIPRIHFPEGFCELENLDIREEVDDPSRPPVNDAGARLVI